MNEYKVDDVMYVVADVTIVKVRVTKVFNVRYKNKEGKETSTIYYHAIPFGDTREIKIDKQPVFNTLSEAKDYSLENLKVLVENTEKQIVSVTEKDFVEKKESKSKKL